MIKRAIQFVLTLMLGFILGALSTRPNCRLDTAAAAPAPREGSQQIAYLSDIDTLSSKVASCGSTIDIDNIHTANQTRDALTNLITQLRNLPTSH